MTREILFDPLLPWPVIAALALAAAAVLGFALWRGLAGWWLRGLAALVLAAALANPALKEEEREALSDIVIAVVDETASQSVSDRAEQTARAVAGLQARVAAMANTDLRLVTVRDAPEGTDSGTLLMGALAEALAEEPLARIAGVVFVTDGQVHDVERAPSLPAPAHVLLTGRAGDWDLRLTVTNAPAFAIVGEPVTLTLRIEAQGAVPEAARGFADLAVAVGGDAAQSVRVPVGQDLELPVTLPHGGMNVIRFEVPAAAGELTDRNNAAIVSINGVRDRLRVLLVSGEPHAGERTWRNLLKSDSAVDLVHFTILRPPTKQDGVPVNELSLIAFPTRELFLEKIDEFDLIIFDRYQQRGILPPVYLDNVRAYAEKGGAVLIAAGPDYAGAESLYRSPLGAVLPAAPTARLVQEGFVPLVSKTGQRHPVTEGLETFAPGPPREDGSPGWGRWFRTVEVTPKSGEVVMTGAGGRPLLILDRVGEGRVALMASDHAWLWHRGFEGGGPQLELLRRLAHWMMKEPELEEEALRASAQGSSITVTRRTMAETAADVTLTAPDGTVSVLALTETAPGRFTATHDAAGIGLYRLSDGTLDAVVALGPSAPREYAETIATGERLAGYVAEGRGGIGITPRAAYVTADVRIRPLLGALVLLLLAAGLTVAAWLREGR
jgi:hypothetical protein